MRKRKRPSPDRRRKRPRPGRLARAGRQTLRSVKVGALPIINRILQRLRLEELLQDYLPPEDKRVKVPAANALLVLVRNLLVSREPLYGIGEWAAGYAPDLLGLTPQQLHNDSTTITFHGNYADAAEEGTRSGQTTLAITWGHNKDHRPDLKQLLYILTLSDDGGVPVHFRAESGNTVDDQTHQETWELLCELAGRRDFLYVADCKLATAENMAYLHQRGGRFITVLPKTRGEDPAFRQTLRQGQVSWRTIHEKTDENEPEKVLDRFSVAQAPTVSAEGYRLLWYHSTRKAEVDDWVRVEIQERIEERYRQERKGRPGKDTRYVKHVTTRFDLSYQVDHGRIAEDQRCDGIFPLVTNVLDLSEGEVLLAYKRQPVIEKRFSQLKTDFRVAPLYLKEVSRIQALLCVYFLVLLVESLLERELRQAMQREGIESLPMYPEDRPCRHPTARRLIDRFDDLQRHTLDNGRDPPVVFVSELSDLQRRILKLLGVPASDYHA